jgi:polyhydroxyalkanoate synthase subunit PhaC
MIDTASKQMEDWLKEAQENTESTYARIEKVMNVITREPDPIVGQTPKQLVWTKNKAKLYRYQPALPKKNKVPLLMIYALINKPYILDLYPGNSLIEHLTNAGHDVYLLDWGTAGYEDRHMNLDDYIMDYIPRAVKKVLQTSGAKELSLLGYCMGGTMTTIFTALHPFLPIRNLLLLTSPIDFEDAGHYTNWLDKRHFNLDRLVDTFGNVPFELIDYGNKLLNPIANVYGPFVSLVDRVDNDEFILNWKLMQKWLNDGIPFPGEAYRQWIREFYQENKLIKNELTVRGQQVDLSNIKANLLNVLATRDNIVAPGQIRPLNDAVSSLDKTLHIVETGHVSVVTGRKAINEIYPFIEQWLSDKSA